MERTAQSCRAEIKCRLFDLARGTPAEEIPAVSNPQYRQGALRHRAAKLIELIRYDYELQR